MRAEKTCNESNNDEFCVQTILFPHGFSLTEEKTAMCIVPFGKTLCGALAFACIAAGAACQQRSAPLETNSNATNATTTNTTTTTNTNATPGTTPALSEGTFTGTSNHTEFNEGLAEALANAIAAAKAGLNTLKVEWRLEELSGVHGGYIPQKSIIVKIHARAVHP